MIKKIIPTLMLALSLPAFQAMAGDQNDYNAKVTHAYINSSGALIMRIDSHNQWITLGQVGDKRAEMMYSTALAAKIANANVWVRYWDHSGDKYSDIKIISVQGQ
ncbi:hypothetical protein [Pseudoalteromonas luteoviolacea]|uniref:Uncharacterized protein n=1 Tax=Pseudoalteromonas luteoviolacea S4054 TaxID=1129367 RepID=A0A0F6ABA4_9GAMM|nr:hypothetical protein [Pseudoalteromonas luteoviolacea]AOT08517.1 hypothetical protein S4054249_11955 [Pseudoalteromonas luteoviolacea]AOT13433.1 hypothetical protein S40542_11930 [Pseudoalteromonas luteoviolacea]AOT18346.1 hypothetical protein S4054_11930 [Pseudoalteromonas luteoviolacea]KKE83487.1 hypothetical protein N479_14035 [Pseudoalteromonas luteoviolacea S4054]KZN75924.1 hypothetical protein N481_06130 [Pseudoalteromonas luteoviolacea S4047-1]